MKIKKTIKAALAVLLTGALLVGCGSAAGKSASSGKGGSSSSSKKAEGQPLSTEKIDSGTKDAKKKDVTLNLADMSVYGIAIFNYSKELGLLDHYFDDLPYNVTINLSEWASGVDQDTAFAANEIDFSSMGNLPAVTGAANGYGTKIIAVNLMYNHDYVLVARKDAGVKTAADLKGKKVGTYLGTVTHYAVAKYLESAGLSLNDVDLLNVQQEAANSLRSGDIDAAVLGNIQAHQLQDEGTVTILDENQTPIYNYVVGREAFFKKYPDLTERVLKLINDTWEQVDADKERYEEFYAEKSGEDLDVVKESWSDGVQGFPERYATDFTEEDLKEYHSFTDWMKQNKYLDSKVDVDKLLDLTYIKKLNPGVTTKE